MLKWLWLTTVVIVLDQVTKYVASTELQFHVPVAVMPSFNWFLAHNTGAAFSFLSDAGGWQRWLFVGLAAIVAVIIVSWLKKLQAQPQKPVVFLKHLYACHHRPFLHDKQVHLGSNH